MEEKKPDDVKAEKKEWKSLLKNIGMNKLILCVLAGVLLVLTAIPSDKKKEQTEESSKSADTRKELDYQEAAEQRLEEILRNMEGVGEVDVLITFQSSSEKILDKNTDNSSSSLSESDKEGGSRSSAEEQRQEETVLLNNSGGNGEPYILKEVSPVVEGVVVLADGGDSPVLAEEINEAVQALFNVSSHKIKVLKRKS